MTMIPCMVCGGEGTVQQGRKCPACGGTAEIEAGFGMSEGHYMGMFNMVVDILDSVNDIKEKLDAIIAEQAAIRQDLTTAIGAIWNKVKDL